MSTPIVRLLHREMYAWSHAFQVLGTACVFMSWGKTVQMSSTYIVLVEAECKMKCSYRVLSAIVYLATKLICTDTGEPFTVPCMCQYTFPLNSKTVAFSH